MKTREEIEENVLWESYANASKWMTKNGVRFRTINEDGQPYIRTDDFDPNRVNLIVKNAYITEISYG